MGIPLSLVTAVKLIPGNVDARGEVIFGFELETEAGSWPLYFTAMAADQMKGFLNTKPTSMRPPLVTS